MTEKKIGIIGFGNMGKAIAAALLKQKVVNKKDLITSNSSQTNKECVKKADIILLAVKPQIMAAVLNEIKNDISDKQLIISIVAGVEIKTIKKIIGDKAIARVVPNLCTLIGESISVWVKTKKVNESQVKLMKLILQSFGKEVLVDEESDLDKVTAISGSGPAYIFYLVELLEQSAIKIGLKKDIAKRLASQTVIGSARLLESTDKSASTLRSEVTSKGGTTEAAFKEFAKLDFDKVFLKGVKAALKRAKQLNLKK